jgi:hypothetical protein
LGLHPTSLQVYDVKLELCILRVADHAYNN